MCMKDGACSESARCPHVLAAAARLWTVATPGHTPQPDGELLGRSSPGRVTSWERCCIPVEACMADGDSGRVQDGEGWTPHGLRQSALATTTICYRPLTSETLGGPASEGPPWVGGERPGGVKAFKGEFGWRAGCRAKAATADSVRSSVSKPLAVSESWGALHGGGADRCAHQLASPAPKLCGR